MKQLDLFHTQKELKLMRQNKYLSEILGEGYYKQQLQKLRDKIK